MENKEIYIDGVDVSGCTRYCVDNGKCTAFKSQYLCSERNNCYTKRILKKNRTINILKEKLLRKEQECEAYKMEAEEGKEINAELKAENDNIKEIFDGLFKVQYKLADNNKKLRQCLTEIKEICKKESGWVNCSDNMPTETAIFAEHILQKISECEGNDADKT